MAEAIYVRWIPNDGAPTVIEIKNRSLEEVLDALDAKFGWQGTPEQKAARDRRFDEMMRARNSTAAKAA